MTLLSRIDSYDISLSLDTIPWTYSPPRRGFLPFWFTQGAKTLSRYGLDAYPSDSPRCWAGWTDVFLFFSWRASQRFNCGSSSKFGLRPLIPLRTVRMFVNISKQKYPLACVLAIRLWTLTHRWLPCFLEQQTPSPENQTPLKRNWSIGQNGAEQSLYNLQDDRPITAALRPPSSFMFLSIRKLLFLKLIEYIQPGIEVLFKIGRASCRERV